MVWRSAWPWALALSAAMFGWACNDDPDTIIVIQGNGGAAGSPGTGGRNAGGSTAAGGTSADAGADGSEGGNSAGGSGNGSGGSGDGSGGSAGSPSAGSGATAGSAGTGGAGGVPNLFVDDFQSGSDGWATSPGSSLWLLVSDGTMAYDQATPADGEFRSASAGDSAWTDIVVEARIKLVQTVNTTADSWAGICARFLDDQNHYCFVLRGDGSAGIRTRVDNAGSWAGNQTLDTPVIKDTWYTVRFSVAGANLSAYIDGAEVFLNEIHTGLASGRIALATYQANARFDDVVVTSN